MYKPKPPAYEGRTIFNRTRPFELFLKFGGGIYTVHFQCGRLVILLEPRKEQ